MIIDDHTHCHEWSFKAGDPEFEGDFVVAEMDRNGIDAAVIMDSCAYLGADQRTSNQHTLEAVKAFPRRFIGFANIKPQKGQQAALDEIALTVGKWGFRGIKLHPAVDQFPANSRLLDPIIDAAVQFDVPVWFHTGHQPYATPTQVGSLAARFPRAKIICGHFGHGLFYDAICAGRKHPSLHFDISFQGRHSFKLAHRELGAERLIFGSDCPYSGPGAVKGVVERAPIPAAAKELILGRNIARLMNINKLEEIELWAGRTPASA